MTTSRFRPSFAAGAAAFGRARLLSWARFSLGRFSLGLCLLGLCSLGLGLLGCGRPATEDECRVILRRAAELQLKDQFAASKEVVAAELDAIEASMKDAMMQKCVGKRVTDGALRCVKRAQTSKELLDVCLD